MVKKASSKKKKGGKARSIRKKTKSGSKSTEVVYHSTKEIKVERELIENFIGLQRVMVNLSAKFDSLSSQISRLLYLFEISAKSLAKKEAEAGSVDAKKIMEKLDNLSQQAGLIGKGLALIHEVGTENEKPMIPLNRPKSNPQFAPKTIQPSFPSNLIVEPSAKKLAGEFAEFEKSITEKNQNKGE